MSLPGGADCYLDDSEFFFEEKAHNGFEMRQVFPNCKPRLLSEYFSEDVWGYMMQKRTGGVSIPQQWKDEGEEFALIAETPDFQYDGNVVRLPANEYFPWLALAKGNIYYHGYWINRDYLKKEFYETMKAELEFAPLKGERNKTYEKQILETNSVALHVRRGDFVRYKWDMPAKAYAAGVLKLREMVTEPHFFIFSDDVTWCRENLDNMGIRTGEATFVEGNSGKNSYIDMQLMSYCKIMMLVSTSSFSYLAALLNRNESLLVINGTGRKV